MAFYPIFRKSHALENLRAIVEAILPADERLSEEVRRGIHSAITEFTSGQVDALAPALRMKVAIGLLMFYAYASMASGRQWHTLPLHARRGFVDRWSFGRALKPRQLFRLLRSLALLAYYEHPAVVPLLAGSTQRVRGPR